MTRVEVLGATRARDDDGVPVPLSAIQRRFLARLALAAPEAVGAETLVDAIWGDDAPATARAALHNQVSRVRRLLHPDAVGTHGTDYALAVRIDAHEVAEATTAAAEQLAEGRAKDAFETAEAALGLWHGTPFADIEHVPEVAPARRALESHRYGLETTRLAAALESDRLDWALPEAQALAAAAPHDERRAALLAEALHRFGRRGEALAVIGAARRLLRSEWGIEPGAELVAVESRILSPAPSAREVGRAPFLGREDELEACLAAVRAGGLVRVVGEPGAGVSRFLRELGRRLVVAQPSQERSDAVLVQCPTHSDTALGVLAEVLEELDAPRQQAGVLADFVPALAGHPRRVTILVDDGHLAGPTTLAALAAAAEHAHVAVVLGSRSPVPDAPAGPTVELGPLSGEHLAQIAAHRLAARHRAGSEVVPADDDVLARLADDAGGNPLLVELLTDALPTGEANQDGLTPLVDGWRARLSPAQDAVLEMVAVISDPVPVELLTALTHHDLAAPDSLLALSPDGRTVQFRHAAVRDVVYRGMSPGRRTELHHAVAETAQRLHLAPSFVAHHRLAGADLDRRTAVEAACEAARAAGRVGAHADAVGWLARAAEHAAVLGERALLEVNIMLGDSMRLAGYPAHLDLLLDCAEHAATLGDADLLRAATFALLQLGGSSDVGAVNQRVAQVTQRALEALAGHESTAGIRAAASLAWSMTGEPDRARALFLAAERDARTPQSRRMVLPYAYLGLGLPDDVPRRATLAEELVTLATDAGDPVALFEGLQLELSTRVALADGPAVRRALDRMHGLIDQVGDVGRRWQLLYLSAAVAHLDGDLERAESLAWRALQLLAPVSPARAAAAFHAQVLPLRLAAGRLGEVTGTVRTLVTEQPAIPAWHAALALCLAHDDGAPGSGPSARREEVEHHLRLVLEHAAPDFTWLAAHVVAARAAAAGGVSREVQDELARRLEPHADLVCWQGTCSYGPVAVPLALLAAARGDASAPELAARARATCESLGAAVFAAELAGL